MSESATITSLEASSEIGPEPKSPVIKVEPESDSELLPQISIKIEPDDEPSVKEECLTEQIKNETSESNKVENNLTSYKDGMILYNGDTNIINQQINIKHELKEEHTQFTLYKDHSVKDEMVISQTEVSEPQSERFKFPKLLQEKVFKCKHCDETFSCKRTLQYHNRNHVPGPSKSKNQVQTKNFKKQSHNCDVCNKFFRNNCSLVRHRLTHSEERPYVCDVCNKGFIQKTNLIYHVRIHTGENPFTCDICHKKFSAKSDMTKHRIIHMPDHHPYACDTCDMRFPRKSNLEKHKLTHLGEKPFQCSMCLKDYTSQGSLNWHAKYHCSKAAVKSVKPYICLTCNATFTSEPSLRYHTRVYHQEFQRVLSCDQCGEVFRRNSSLIRHKLSHLPDKPFICDLCNKGFIQKCHLIEHLHMHAGVKPYLCDICGKRFLSKSQMNKHRVRHMSGPKTVSCRICKERFKNLMDWRLHKKVYHNKLKAFACDICSKCFRNCYRLDRHKLTHGDRRAFPCNLCSRSFVQKPHLVSHLLVHTGEKPFECDMCDKRFTRKTHLNVHRRKHMGLELYPCSRIYPCDLCDKQFTRKASLMQHRKIHQPELVTLVQCHDCDKKFSNKSGLRHHICLTHRPSRYKCEYCGKPFYYKSDHDRHKESHIPQICTVCNLRFPNKKLLGNHECILSIDVDVKKE